MLLIIVFQYNVWEILMTLEIPLLCYIRILSFFSIKRTYLYLSIFNWRGFLHFYIPTFLRCLICNPSELNYTFVLWSVLFDLPLFQSLVMKSYTSYTSSCMQDDPLNMTSKRRSNVSFDKNHNMIIMLPLSMYDCFITCLYWYICIVIMITFGSH